MNGLKIKPAISFNQRSADHLSLNHNVIHRTPPHCELIISLQKQQLDTLQHKILNNEMRATLEVKGQLSVGIMVGTYIRINASHNRANLCINCTHTNCIRLILQDIVHGSKLVVCQLQENPRN